MRGKNSVAAVAIAIPSTIASSALALDAQFTIAHPTITTGLVFTGTASWPGGGSSFGDTASPEAKLIEVNGSTSGGLVEGAGSLKGEIIDSPLAGGQNTTTLQFTGSWLATQPEDYGGSITAIIEDSGLLRLQLDETVVVAIEAPPDQVNIISIFVGAGDTGQKIGNLLTPGTYTIDVQWGLGLGPSQTINQKTLDWTMTLTPVLPGVIFVDENYQFTGTASWPAGDGYEAGVAGASTSSTYDQKLVSVNGSTSGGLVDIQANVDVTAAIEEPEGAAEQTIVTFDLVAQGSQGENVNGSFSVLFDVEVHFKTDQEMAFSIQETGIGFSGVTFEPVFGQGGEIVGDHLLPGVYRIYKSGAVDMSSNELEIYGELNWTLTLMAIPRERGPIFTGGEIAVFGGSTWSIPEPPGFDTDVASGSHSIEPKLAEGGGSTSGGLVDINGEMSATGNITAAEGFFNQYVIDFYISEIVSIGKGVDGVVDLQLDGLIDLHLDQAYAFMIEQDGPAGADVGPDLDSETPGQIVGDVMMPGAYKISISSQVASTSSIVKQTTWVMTMTALGNPNSPPECPDDITFNLWPPNHQYHEIDLNAIAGATDPDDDEISYTILSITQDEPSNSNGDGDTTCDGVGAGSDTALIRAERKGNGDGRVYHINYVADDGNGGTCEGVVTITVPKSVSQPAVDSGQTYMSRDCFTAADINADAMVNIDDLLWVINTWGDTGPDETLNWPDADTNIDGIVDVFDLLTVINNWGPA